MKHYKITLLALLTLFVFSCGEEDRDVPPNDLALPGYDGDFKVVADEFADLEILRFQVPGFEELSLDQKKLAYYLSEAALAGRDIFFDQMGAYNLMIRKTLENMFTTFSGDKSTEEWQQFKTYCGRFWFSYGFHHHYANEKFFPDCPVDYFISVAENSASSGFPLEEGEDLGTFLDRVTDLIYNPEIEPKRTEQSGDDDLVQASSVNFYRGVTQKEVEDFYAKFESSGNQPMWGLNSQLTKEDGRVYEKIWKIGGMYSEALTEIVHWLDKAVTVAENEAQKKSLELLIAYYETGDLKKFDEHSIAWVQDTASRIDVINGFIEVYQDPLGRKGSFESVVSMKDLEASRQINTLARNAQWFEDHSPIMDEHKKKNVTGIVAKAITVIQESADASPATPIGINLPNNEWIRRDHGSKSVSLSNIIHSYNISSSAGGMLDEFVPDEAVKARIREYGSLAEDLHTEMHEAIGHASGQINPGVATPDKTLKNYASALEEARADLVALYYGMDEKLVDLGLMPSLETGKAMYDNYMLNGLMTQLRRLKPGENLEEAHMRNRQLNAMWVYEKGKADNVVELVQKDGKTFVVIHDYEKLKELFGQLLREIQRVKSEGDFQAGKDLVEKYGVKVDPALHREVLDRFADLNLKPYKGFIQPKLVPVMDGGEITDVLIEYPDDFFEQMIEYGEKYAFLPLKN